MPSLIEGYNYDIFISYRQKDNKGDRWVSEFVEALKTELESTFKEEISVYFDINPHDGLLETHDVDESLKEKLKCLIFIPIISRTYCDPKSFAWEHEFKAFVEQASNDQFGLKVKLPNGNVASRVLPVQIHDLKADDKSLVEKALGGFLRSIEFIYTEPGVNRPLTAKDSEDRNINKTFYRNQINKVANAIDEIISVFREETETGVKQKEKSEKSVIETREEGKRPDLKQPDKGNKGKFLVPIIIFALLIIAGIIAYPKIFKRDSLERLRESGNRISVAVMPFQNLTSDESKNFWQDMIQDNMITSLSNFQDIKVRQAESINTLLQKSDLTNYASITPSVAGNLAQKLEANIFIQGSISQTGDIIRLNAKLIEAETEEVFKSFQIDGTGENILFMADSLSAMVKDYLIVSILKEKIPPDFQVLAGSTKSPEALRYYLDGQKAFFRIDYSTARELYHRAIEIDPNFNSAAIMLAFAYGNDGLYEDARKWASTAYKNRDRMARFDKAMSEYIYALFVLIDPAEVIKCLEQLLEIDDLEAFSYYNLGDIYLEIHNYDKAIPEFEKALEIYESWGIKPFWVFCYTELGWAYHETGQYNKERKLYIKAEKDFPDDPALIFQQAVLAFSEGKTDAANELIYKYISVRKEKSGSDVNIATYLARIYLDAKIPDKEEEQYRKALSLQPESWDIMNDLAYFLINTERNIPEGMELMDTLIKYNPDNYNYLHTKGWGLYKQGKYQEALEILQKSWDIRKEKAIYNHEAFLHLEAAKKAVAEQK
jgi:tetratricopeptide (TPR) repeat protein